MTGATTRSGIPLNAHYTAANGSADQVGEVPGIYPFTRGRARPPHAGNGWIHRELSGEGDARRSNEQLKYLIGIGQMGIDVIGDSPTQSMLDADHPLVKHSVGTQGVSLSRLEDHIELMRDIPMERISISSSVPSIFALTGLVGAAQTYGVPLDKVRGSILHGPLFVANAAYDCGMPVPLLSRISVDTMAFCAQHMPRFHAYLEDTYFFSECGLTAVEEMALGFVEIRHLVRAVMRRGISIDSFAPRIAILVNCSMDFFEEVAKIRATRRLFAQMMKDEFGALEPRSMSVVITSHTSGLTLTAQQPINNVVRGTVQGLALAFAGVQAMEISAFDEGFRTPSAEAHLVGIRTQQILAEETGITKVTDPLGGSYFIEDLTNEMASRIQTMVDEIEATGDPVELAERGYFRRLFDQASERHVRSITSGKQQIVGVNCHQLAPEQDQLLRDIAESKIAPCLDSITVLRKFREARNQDAVHRALRKVHRDAKTTDTNLVPSVLAAFQAEATMGEIAGAMRLAYDAPYDPHGAMRPTF